MTKTFLKAMGEGESEIREMHDTAAYDARDANNAGNTNRERVTAQR